jgi:hypothetical protein
MALISLAFILFAPKQLPGCNHVLVYFVVTCNFFWYNAYTFILSSAYASFITIHMLSCSCKSYMQSYMQVLFSRVDRL